MDNLVTILFHGKWYYIAQDFGYDTNRFATDEIFLIGILVEIESGNKTNLAYSHRCSGQIMIAKHTDGTC